MPGFYITNCSAPLSANAAFDSFCCISESTQVDGYAIWRNTRNQFLDDKIFYQNDDYMIVMESIVLNKRALMENYRQTSFLDTIITMIDQNPVCFFDQLKGMFSGAVYFKKTMRWVIFTDQLGSKPLFYFVNKGNVIIGSQLDYITKTMANNGIERKADENGFRQFLLYGCYMDEHSGVELVKRLYPGDFAVIDSGNIAVNTYHRFSEKTNDGITDDDAIDLLDNAFKRAIQRGVEKNNEYGYKGLVDISGGADSRMIAYALKASGQDHYIMCHYSQSGSNESIISQRIANDLDYEYYYRSLDDAKFMLDIDRITCMNSGTAYYCGITGGERLLHSLSGQNIGIEFTGLLGNVFDGGMLTQYGEECPTLSHGNYLCTKVLDQNSIHISALDRFQTNDLFWLYERGMLCGMSTFLTRSFYVEPYTPYGDIEFIQAWLTIPWERKVKDRLLLRWMQRQYPESMEIPYASTGVKLSYELGPIHKARIAKLMVRIRNKLKSFKTGYSAASMNPIQFWEKSKPWLKKGLEEYYSENMKTLQNGDFVSQDLVDEIQAAYTASGMIGKYVALTLLSYYKNYIAN
ncbi:MAG: hypothetical protein ACLSX2_03080 [Christensenellaceae bacterium]